jgi:hypothetical protein
VALTVTARVAGADGTAAVTARTTELVGATVVGVGVPEVLAEACATNAPVSATDPRTLAAPIARRVRRAGCARRRRVGRTARSTRCTWFVSLVSFV